MGELKPCPFCGGEARIAEATVFMQRQFEPCCVKCNCVLGIFETAEYAASAWNRRAEVKSDVL